MVLFEKATFLVISHATHTAHTDVHRFEKISNIIKQFKLRYDRRRWKRGGVGRQNNKRLICGNGALKRFRSYPV